MLLSINCQLKAPFTNYDPSEKFKWDMMKRVSVTHMTETCFRYLLITPCKLYPSDPYYLKAILIALSKASKTKIPNGTLFYEGFPTPTISFESLTLFS